MNLTAHIKTSLTGPDAAAVQAIAARDRCSLSSVVRRLVSQGLEQKSEGAEGAEA